MSQKNQKVLALTTEKKLSSLAFHLIFRPGRALASRPLAIPSFLSSF